jgi:hypothetical protein
VIEAGTRVRVTYEGVATEGGDHTFVWVRPDGFDGECLAPTEFVEVLAPPKPQYQVGQVYQMTENGCTYLRTAFGWKQLLTWGVDYDTPDSAYDGFTFVRLVPETK